MLVLPSSRGRSTPTHCGLETDWFCYSQRGISMCHNPDRHHAGVPLEVHEPTVARMREHYGKRGIELNDARLRMATLPAGAEVGLCPQTAAVYINCSGA